jgi:hypothetical protein
MNKYQNGKIYKIVCNVTGDVYVGSTIKTLEKRLIHHKSDAKMKQNICSYIIIDRGDYKIELIEDYPCNNSKELRNREGYYQKKLNCINTRIAGRDGKAWREDNKEHLKKKRKQYCIDNAESIAEYHKEYAKNNKEHRSKYMKEYHIKNRDKIIQKSKKYYDENKEKINEYKKNYYQTNKEKLKNKEKQRRLNNLEEYKKKRREYYQKNKERINRERKEKRLKNKTPLVVHNCECGGSYTRGKARHFKTKKHISFYSN